MLKSRIDIGEACIKADRLHLTNILHNLLDNALKYCKDVPRLTLRARARDGEIRITIADEGIGIPKDHLNKVFNKFYRIPTGNVHKVKGFGLGLYYVKSICDAHGWRIRLESQEGKGTCIYLDIPEAQQSSWLHWRRFWQRAHLRLRQFTARA